jgi:hypothetical protein
MIARKIHYCWFGGRPLPLQARRCLASWVYHLPNYEVVRWDEQTFDVESHPFVAAAYAAGSYAFVSDYVRMHVLHAHGGIYLDVDVEMRADFERLLAYDFFIGLEDHQRFGTSVIGSAAGHWLPMQMLSYYDKTPFDSRSLSALVNVNEVSRLLLANGFSGLQGQVVGLQRVEPIGVFAQANKAVVDASAQPIAKHLYAGSWRVRTGKSAISNIWRSLRKLPEQVVAISYLYFYRFAAKCRHRSGG